MPDSSLSTTNPLGAGCYWTFRETRNGLAVAKSVTKNLHTSYGLTAYAGAFGGNYLAPQYLVLNTATATIVSLSGTTLSLSARLDQPSDTQLVLNPDQPTPANQEAVTFVGTPTLVSGNWVYILSAAPVFSHAAGETVTRQVSASDTLAVVTSEIEFDTTNFPGQRATSIGGYSPGPSQFIMQFFITGDQAADQTFGTIGLSDSLYVGLGNLHNHFVSGYMHTAGNDLEIDVLLTLTNS